MGEAAISDILHRYKCNSFYKLPVAKGCYENCIFAIFRIEI